MRYDLRRITGLDWRGPIEDRWSAMLPDGDVVRIWHGISIWRVDRIRRGHVRQYCGLTVSSALRRAGVRLHGPVAAVDNEWRAEPVVIRREMRVSEIVADLGCSQHMVYDHIARGLLPATKRGRLLVISRADYEGWRADVVKAAERRMEEARGDV